MSKQTKFRDRIIRPTPADGYLWWYKPSSAIVFSVLFFGVIAVVSQLAMHDDYHFATMIAGFATVLFFAIPYGIIGYFVAKTKNNHQVIYTNRVAKTVEMPFVTPFLLYAGTMHLLMFAMVLFLIVGFYVKHNRFSLG